MKHIIFIVDAIAMRALWSVRLSRRRSLPQRVQREVSPVRINELLSRWEDMAKLKNWPLTPYPSAFYTDIATDSMLAVSLFSFERFGRIAKLKWSKENLAPLGTRGGEVF